MLHLIDLTTNLHQRGHLQTCWNIIARRKKCPLIQQLTSKSVITVVKFYGEVSKGELIDFCMQINF